MPHNITRAERMKARTIAQLLDMVVEGSLSSTAAEKELRRRGLMAIRTNSGWHLASAEPWIAR